MTNCMFFFFQASKDISIVKTEKNPDSGSDFDDDDDPDKTEVPGKRNEITLNSIGPLPKIFSF